MAPAGDRQEAQRIWRLWRPGSVLSSKFPFDESVQVRACVVVVPPGKKTAISMGCCASTDAGERRVSAAPQPLNSNRNPPPALADPPDSVNDLSGALNVASLSPWQQGGTPFDFLPPPLGNPLETIAAADQRSASLPTVMTPSDVVLSVAGSPMNGSERSLAGSMSALSDFVDEALAGESF